ncbi:MAG: NADH-quinone oxidoreductase subunit N [Planctomycetota bacterium]|nr:MAG: NADH-quinone oxidoreductase subunit N [Planctomycetota bacterium]
MSPELLADFAAIAPEMWLVGAILATVIADLFVGQRGRYFVGALALAGVGMALCKLSDGATGGSDGTAFGMLAVDGHAAFFRALILAGTGLVILHGLVFRGMEDSSRNEFIPMVLGTGLGASLLVASDNLIMLLLSMELLSLSSYLLAGWQRKERRSSEAALKYLIYGAVASAIMTFGFSLVWGLTGSMNLSEIGHRLALDVLGDNAPGFGMVMATVLVFVGLFFKASVFPFHFWAPDVYEGAPTPVTTLLAVVSKAAAFGVLVRFVDAVFLAGQEPYELLESLGWIVAVLAAVTMTYGNITAVLQRNVKRLLGYSSIAHAGYLLMGVAVMLVGDEATADMGRESLLFYMATYYLATIGAFGCAMYLANRFGAEDTDDYQGLAWSAPYVCGAMVVFLVSLTGLPPTVGFVGKLYLLKASWAGGLEWLAVVASLNAVVALYYYFKVARALFLRGEQTVVPGTPHKGLVPVIAYASLFALAGATIWYTFSDVLIVWAEASPL